MSKKNKNLDQVIKTARFAYYALYIYEVRDDGNEHKVDVFDFEKWLDKQDIRKYQPLSSGGKLMISDIVSFKTNEPYNLKAIRIYKTRDNIVPELTREGKEPTVVDLREGENISEALFLLYDPKFKILMVQNNKFSLSLAQLAEWLSRSIHDDRQVVRIEQIFDPSSIDKIKKSKIKNFSIRVANPSIIARGSNLWNLIERPLEYESTAITIKLGVGRSRKNHLKPESINPLVDEVLGLEEQGPSTVRTLRSLMRRPNELITITYLRINFATEFLIKWGKMAFMTFKKSQRRWQICITNERVV